MSRHRRAPAATALIVAAAVAVLGVGARQPAGAAGLDFQENQTANFTAHLVGEALDDAFDDHPAFAGVQTTSTGVEVLLAATPSADQQAKLASLQAHQQETLAKNRLVPSNPPFVPVTFRQVPHSKKDLQALSARIRVDQPTWAAAGIQLSAWGPRYETGTVLVHLARYSAADADQLVEAYGPMVRVSTESMTATGSASRQSSQSP